jgi:AraC-like DNA-binding protein
MTLRVERPEEVRFRHPTLGTVGIEVMHLSTLRQRVSARHLAAPQRVEFFMLLFISDGALRHVVDFSTLQLGAGSLVVVRPGQVQHWHLDEQAQGCMVLIDPPALTPVTSSPRARDALLAAMTEWPTGVQLDDAFAADLRRALDGLAADLAAFDGTTDDVTLIRQGLLTVLLRLARWHRKRSQGVPQLPAGRLQVFRLFEAELERHFRSHRSVADYARRLGYSVSTLNRACQDATGQQAKVLVDRRLAMEAARMLVHASVSVAAIGHALGFSEPTNFIRFFVRMVGSTPLRFRERYTARGGAG